MVIDSHVHLFSPDMIAERRRLRERDRWFELLYAADTARMADAPALLTEMDAAGVDQSVAFGFAFADPGLCRACNDYVLSAAAEAPERIVPLAVVNPRNGEAACREARRCLEAGAKGIGELMPDGQGYCLDGDDCLHDLMALARAYAAPIVIHVNEQVGHAYPGKGQQGPERAYTLAQRYPDNRLVLAHWGGGLPFYELMPEVRQALRNVTYDTAASLYLYDDAIFSQVMSWAPQKVLFGSDFPLIRQTRFLRRIRRLGLDADSLSRLLYDNARAVFGIDSDEASCPEILEEARPDACPDARPESAEGPAEGACPELAEGSVPQVARAPSPPLGRRPPSPDRSAPEDR